MSIVREFERAFNRQDVAALVACFTPDGSYHDTFFGGHAGAGTMRTMFERMFHEGRDYVWTMEKVVETDGAAASEWTFAYTVTEAIPRSAGRKVRFRGMSFFEKRDGKISAYRESFDMGAALLQLGFSPEATAKTIRRRVIAP
ncbi:MAG TPA: nuclear transport factor 2 family protein [Candidatus Bathyarchaeia archaeon]|nr:nuclear transport factor 2 family protein [Candidatus Bathyarchaeia archaeon]